MAAISKYRETLEQQGYLIVKDVLNAETCQILNEAIFQRLDQIIFASADPTITREDKIQMLTDKAHRVKLLGPEAAGLVWRNANSRQPLISKSTGMTDHHYIPEVLEHIAFNPKLRQLAAELYGIEEEELAFRAGIDRFCFKAPGSTKMDEHLDRNLFEDANNYSRRIQCLVTTQICDKTKPSQTGTIQILDGFHRYFDLSRHLMHPKTGLYPFPDVAASYSRFFQLKGFKGGHREFVKILNRVIPLYTEYLWKNITPPEFYITTFDRIKAIGVTVPEIPILLEWKAIKLEPGDAFFWTQDLPHMSSPNKSHIPRICFYWSVMPKPDPEWRSSPEGQWVALQALELRFSYGVQAHKFPTTANNPEELEYFRKHPAEKQRALDLITGSSFSRKMCGLE